MAGGVDWQQILAKHQRWLRTVVYARLGNPDAVDEVMQEVALAAVEQRAPISDPQRVAPWLYRLALNHIFMHRRRLGRRRRAMRRFAQSPPVGNGQAPGPLEWLLDREREQLVRRGLEQLRPRDRELLLLKYGHDWSYRQLSAHMGISVSAIESRLHRARARLRAVLAAEELSEVVNYADRK